MTARSSLPHSTTRRFRMRWPHERRFNSSEIEIAHGAVAAESCKARLGLAKHETGPVKMGIDPDVANSLSSD